MTVTELREIRPEHFEIGFSDGRALKAGVETVVDFGLFVGRELDDGDFAALREAADMSRAKERALRMIGARPLGSRELYGKLIEKGESEAHSAAAVARMVELGFVNDAEYARSLVRHYSAKGYGARRIKDELYRRRLPRELWDEALEEMPDTDDTLDRLLASRMRGAAPDDKAAVKKATDALMRRGYNWEEIRSALYRYTSQLEE